MASRLIHHIQTLARRFRANERNLSLYFPDFETPPAPGSLNRVFGPPVGISTGTWPVYPRLSEVVAEREPWQGGDLRMEHVFTIDLEGVNMLGIPPGARAMMLFISSARGHRAVHPLNAETMVVFLGQEEVARGLYRGAIPDRSLRRWSRRFSLVRIDVPGDVFDPTSEDDAVVELHDAIWQAPARLGGCPIWVRDPGEPLDLTMRFDAESFAARPKFDLRGGPEFLMQFERRFADVELGRQGVMYVTGSGAYYQSY